MKGDASWGKESGSWTLPRLAGSLGSPAKVSWWLLGPPGLEEGKAELARPPLPGDCEPLARGSSPAPSASCRDPPPPPPVCTAAAAAPRRSAFPKRGWAASSGARGVGRAGGLGSGGSGPAQELREGRLEGEAGECGRPGSSVGSAAGFCGLF